ncbi:mpeU [Symbiodinium necroappetens]|uniref:MpeU protein n=1 Tax=Symbiodinium necroappetens TaxID=1628268 RepID=A0A812XLB0_9DINO|nr:mpeU [Symbiodinium necroappetens]
MQSDLFGADCRFACIVPEQSALDAVAQRLWVLNPVEREDTGISEAASKSEFRQLPSINPDVNPVVVVNRSVVAQRLPVSTSIHKSIHIGITKVSTSVSKGIHTGILTPSSPPVLTTSAGRRAVVSSVPSYPFYPHRNPDPYPHRRPLVVVPLCIRPRLYSPESSPPVLTPLSSPPLLVVAPSSDLDLRSLVLKQPGFTFLKSRELFLAETANCDERMRGVKLVKVKKSTEARRAQLAQRFRVKQAKTMLQAAAQNKLSTGTLREALLGVPGEEEHMPAVELHMYPEDPRNVSSQWRALLVPIARGAFKTLFLCQPALPSSSMSRCIARLPFEPLPFYPSSLAGNWYSSLDRHRSSPALLLLAMEVVLACGSLALLALCLVAGYAMLTKGGGDGDGKASVFSAVNWSFPCKCCLTQHAHLYRETGEQVDHEPLDAGSCVIVQEAQRGKVQLPLSFWIFRGDWAEAVKTMLGKPTQKLWARVEEPAGWLLLTKEDDFLPRAVNAETMPQAVFKVHPDLVPPLPVLLRSTLVMLSVHVTSQWILVEYFTGMYSFPAMMYLVFGTVTSHVLVMLERYRTSVLGTQYEEVLQTERHLLSLRMASTKTVIVFAILQVTMLGTLLSRLTTVSSKQIPAELGFLAGLALHAKAMYDTSSVRQKWREPQLASKEIYEFANKAMPITSTTPKTLSSQRAQSLSLVWCLTLSVVVIALMLVARITLDVLQLRGELVAYSFTRGKLMSPSGSQSFHNTLLLDQNADSFTVDLQFGDFTRSVQIELVHPLLTDEEPLIVTASGEQQLSLPSGPLYSQLMFHAVGDYVTTTYVIHILRVGEAISIGLSASFDKVKYPDLAGEVFHEEHRLQYQLRHRLWYVPDIDLSNNGTLLVTMTSLVLAPMISPFQVHVGNATFYIYQHNADQTIYADLGKAGVAGMDSGMLQWLQDTRFSGKWVRLTSGLAFAAESSENHSLNTVFRLTGALKALQDDNKLIQIGVTQDMTNSEVLEVPLMLLSGAPSPFLHSKEQSEDKFLLPSFSPDLRTDYAVCGGHGKLDDVEVSVSDPRFLTVSTDLQEPGSCDTVTKREFRSIRKDNTGCGKWCEHYLPRTGRYDMSVARSASLCLQFAMDLLNESALNNTLFMTEGAGKNPCVDEGWLTQAILLNFTAGVEILLSFDASPDAIFQGVTPLQTAAVQGNVLTLRKLLNKSKDVAARTAGMLAAGRHCHAEAMELFREYGATAANASTCDDSMLMTVVKERAMNSEACQQKAQSTTAERRQNYTALWDVLAILKQMDNASYNECRGPTLKKALVRPDLAAVELLLDGEEKVDELAGRPGRPLTRILMNLLSAEKVTDEVFLMATELLHRHGMDLQPQKYALLPFVACRCSVRLVRELLDLGAKPEGLYSRKNASASVASSECTGPEKEAIQVTKDLAKGVALSMRIQTACVFLPVIGVRPHLDRESCGGVPGAFTVTGTECRCDTQLFGPGSAKASEAALVRGRCLTQKEFDQRCQDAGGVAKYGGCECVYEFVGDPAYCGKLPESIPLETHSGFGSRCYSKEEIGATIKQRSAYDHITNDALKFCTGLLALVQKELPLEERREQWRIGVRVEDALQHDDREKICQAALAQQITPKLADEELLGLHESIDAPEPGEKTRAYQVLVDGVSRTDHSWQDLLNSVCADECRDLLELMESATLELVEAAVSVDSKAGTIQEICGKHVVQKAEAEVLTCCGQECGWDNRICRLWPFFDPSERLDWNARCCAEGTILKDSSRERLCNSVQPKEKREKLYENDAKQETQQDALLVGQDRAPQPGPSLLQSYAGEVQCDVLGAKCGKEEQRALFLKACKEHKEEQWHFLDSTAYKKFVSLEHVHIVSGDTSIRACYAKLTGDVDAVSWYMKTCHFVHSSDREIEAIQDTYDATDPEVPDVVDGVALFKQKQ